MGISNSIGSNTFDILLCLGLPWLIKSSFSPTTPGKHYISINSGGLEYSAISLLSTLLLLYIAFASNRFQLDKKVGRACLCMYAVFLILASLIELNVFFTVNLPTCQRTVKWRRHRRSPTSPHVHWHDRRVPLMPTSLLSNFHDRWRWYVQFFATPTRTTPAPSEFISPRRSEWRSSRDNHTLYE